MSQFTEFNAENKLRLPLSGYAAHVIENDVFSFSKKKTTLINAIILNSYQTAECTISLRIKEFRSELSEYLTTDDKSSVNTALIDRIIEGKIKELKKKYANRYTADVNWQVTLSKRVKELLTEDPYTSEEKYYGQRPGHYVRALIENYARLPYYMREEIIFKNIFDTTNMAIDGQYILNITNKNGIHFSIKPYSIQTDPLSMFHYIIGYNTMYEGKINETQIPVPEIISLRLSRIERADIQYLSSGKLCEKELVRIKQELETKGVQFVTSDKSTVQIWLSDTGIKRYKNQAHLRPTLLYVDPNNDHIYHFECTETQILFYFFGFGNDAKIITPPELVAKFKEKYKESYNLYIENNM